MNVDICLMIIFLSALATPLHGNKSYCKAREASCIIESFGYSPSCVMNALSTCEKNSLYSAIETEVAKITRAVSSILPRGAAAGASSRPRNCADLKKNGDTSGVRTIFPYDSLPDKPVKVYCDQSTHGGGWTMLVRRDDLPFRENFNRTWVEYSLGFGNLDQEFWLGLDHIHALTNSELMELRVDIEDWEDQKRFAIYRYFYVGDAASKYILKIGGYSGDAGDSFVSEFPRYNHDGMMFTTLDNDNDQYSENCAGGPLGGWWYNKCHISTFTGRDLVGAAATVGQGITWHEFRGTFYSLRRALMMIRPAFNR